MILATTHVLSCPVLSLLSLAVRDHRSNFLFPAGAGVPLWSPRLSGSERRPGRGLRERGMRAPRFQMADLRTVQTTEGRGWHVPLLLTLDAEEKKRVGISSEGGEQDRGGFCTRGPGLFAMLGRDS